jgi:hypothetical protein
MAKLEEHARKVQAGLICAVADQSLQRLLLQHRGLSTKSHGSDDFSSKQAIDMDFIDDECLVELFEFSKAFDSGRHGQGRVQEGFVDDLLRFCTNNLH